MTCLYKRCNSFSCHAYLRRRCVFGIQNSDTFPCNRAGVAGCRSTLTSHRLIYKMLTYRTLCNRPLLAVKRRMELYACTYRRHPARTWYGSFQFSNLMKIPAHFRDLWLSTFQQLLTAVRPIPACCDAVCRPHHAINKL